MNWTKRTLLAAAALAAISIAGPTSGRAAEPEDAGLSAAQSGVRDARDQALPKRENNEVRRAQTKCPEGSKTDCPVKPETTGQARPH
jgi:hypothetical protein